VIHEVTHSAGCYWYLKVTGSGNANSIVLDDRIRYSIRTELTYFGRAWN